MFSSDNLNSLMRDIMSRLGGNNSSNSSGNNSSNNSKKLSLGPSHALVIAGLLGGVFEVTSVLVDKNQLVEIVLSGSLKQKTDLEKMMDQIGSMPFDEVLKTVLGRL